MPRFWHGSARAAANERSWMSIFFGGHRAETELLGWLRDAGVGEVVLGEVVAKLNAEMHERMKEEAPLEWRVELLPLEDDKAGASRRSGPSLEPDARAGRDVEVITVDNSPAAWGHL